MKTYLPHLRAQLTHGVWADARLLNALRTTTVSVPVALRELAHIRGAQEVWLSRIHQRTSILAVWPELTLPELEFHGTILDAALQSFFEALESDALDRRVEYSNTAGIAFNTPLIDILQHLFLHGHYHRAKASVALREAGITPPMLDYILWRRETLDP